MATKTKKTKAVPATLDDLQYLITHLVNLAEARSTLLAPYQDAVMMADLPVVKLIDAELEASTRALAKLREERFPAPAAAPEAKIGLPN